MASDGSGLGPVGGFQGGFRARVIPREQARFREYLVCGHQCGVVIQLVSCVSREPELELCVIEAERLGRVLLEAVSAAGG